MNKPHKTTLRERKIKRLISHSVQHEHVPMLAKIKKHERKMKHDKNYRHHYEKHHANEASRGQETS